jgi:hypothetical protein
MKLICAPSDHKFNDAKDRLNVVLFGRADRQIRGSAGGAIRDLISDSRLYPAAKAWDFLSLALAVMAADLAGHRTKSADGWTRELEIEVAVADSVFWNTQRDAVRFLLGFLTNDLWNVNFIGQGYAPKPPKRSVLPSEDCVSLLSGGLDSFVGNVDLAAAGKRPFAISQTVVGDAENQRAFAKVIGGGLRHLQMNHNADVPNPETPSTQRARSLIFLAYGVLAATTLKQYHDGGAVTIYVPENGFISINPPLTEMRVGSLSTRTTHPVFFRGVRELFREAGLRVDLENPYQLKTKGEMLKGCADQRLLRTYASETTSCGRYLIHGHKHCGRCVPCMVRRAAFHFAGMADNTKYVYKNLGRDDEDHVRFDDVRSVAMAVIEAKNEGLEKWLGTALSTALLGDVSQPEAMVGRALKELEALLQVYGVK